MHSVSYKVEGAETSWRKKKRLYWRDMLSPSASKSPLAGSTARPPLHNHSWYRIQWKEYTVFIYICKYTYHICLCASLNRLLNRRMRIPNDRQNRNRGTHALKGRALFIDTTPLLFRCWELSVYSIMRVCLSVFVAVEIFLLLVGFFSSNVPEKYKVWQEMYKASRAPEPRHPPGSTAFCLQKRLKEKSKTHRLLKRSRLFLLLHQSRISAAAPFRSVCVCVFRLSSPTHTL